MFDFIAESPIIAHIVQPEPARAARRQLCIGHDWVRIQKREIELQHAHRD